MLAFFYTIGICVVAAVLFVAINKLEPNRHHAFSLKLVVVATAGAAILNNLMR